MSVKGSKRIPEVKIRKFAREYVKTGSSTKAYASISDSTNKNTLACNGHKMKSRPEVQEYIERLTNYYDLNEEWCKIRYLEIHNDNEIDIKTRVHCLDKLSDITGATKKREEIPQQQVNIVNIIQTLKDNNIEITRGTTNINKNSPEEYTEKDWNND